MHDHNDRPTRRRGLRPSAWALATTTALSLLVLAAPQSASAAAVIDPIGDARAGEGLVMSFTTGETGTLVVTAPEHATIGIVTTGGCDTRYATQVRCGTDAKVWTSELMATMRVDPDAPAGTLTGGSIAFEVRGTVVASTPFTIEVLPPHIGQAAAGQTTAMEVPVNGGTSGVMRFTAPDRTTIVGTGAPDCVIGPDGSTADCGTESSVWDGVQTVDLAVDADAPYGTLRGGTMGFVQNGRIASTTPFELELTPGAATITAPADGVLAPDATLSGTAPVGTEVGIEVDGVPIGTAEATIEETWAFRPTESLAEGTHTVTVRARAGGLAGAATDLVVTVVAPSEPVAPEIPEIPGVPEGPALPGGQQVEPATSTTTPVDVGSSPRGSEDTLVRTGADAAPFALAIALLLGGAFVGVVGLTRSRVNGLG
ncbi:hypothetical protein [Plantibacter cousiniae (nom. nud.)]|uniref:hypothetical protein n=1 Tax=Plantibacter cousiniae (nom. nud.) TaxID=199709 RepID=UPI001D39AA19|nr:hypothetical protein [Plantibacter cousiniae]CAH0179500.1 hypothetical protein SRABI02_01449 [Plantibacter cousiniae]